MALTKVTYSMIQGSPVNVLDFGAVGDGSTDDTVAIQAALDSFGGNAGTVEFPAGTYIISSEVSVPSNITMLGYGAKITVLATPNYYFFFAASKSNIVVDGFVFDGGDFGSTTNNALFAFRQCSNVYISNCQFIKFDVVGLAINAGSNYNIENNFFQKTTYAHTRNQSINVSSSAGIVQYSLISKNIILNSGIDVSMYASEISSNYISGWGFGAGITTEQDSANCKQLRILNNWCGNSVGIDVNLTVCNGIENWAHYSIVSGNILVNNAGTGIDHGGVHGIVSNNFCLNNGTYADSSGIVARYGSSTYNANYTLFEGNACYDSAGASGTQSYGYQEQSASLIGIVLTGNQFQNNKTGNVSILSTTTGYAGQVYSNTRSIAPAPIVNGARATFNVAVNSASPGDIVSVAYTQDLQGVQIFGYVDSSNDVQVVFQNNTGSTITLAAGTMLAQVQKTKLSPVY